MDRNHDSSPKGEDLGEGKPLGDGKGAGSLAVNSAKINCPRVIVHIDMDAYFASVEQAINPFLKGKPIIVCGNPKTKTVVASCSYEAKKEGVKSGMSIPEARALCPEAILIAGEPIRYAETSRKIFSLLTAFTDSVEIFSIDEGFMDMSGLVDLYGGEENLGKAIKKKIREETGLTCSAGIAPNKLLAKIATSICKPDGLKIIKPDSVAEFMKTLPVEKVPGFGPKLCTILSDRGITTCADIKRLNAEFFTERFGVRGRIIYDYACGIDDSPVWKTPPQPKSIGHSYTLPCNTSNLEFLRTVLFRLSEQVAERMRRENYHGKVVTLCIRLEDFFTFTRRKKYSEVPADGKRIFNLAWEIFSGLSLNKQVRLLGVSVAELARTEEALLFPGEEKRERLFHTVDSINAEFGEASVFPATLLMEKRLHPPITKTHAFYFWRFRPAP